MTDGPTEPDGTVVEPDSLEESTEDSTDAGIPTDQHAGIPTDQHAGVPTDEPGAPTDEPGAPTDEQSADDAESSSRTTSSKTPGDLLEREGEVAADYLEGLLDIIDADGDIDMDVEGDRAVVSVIGDRLRHLVGPRGAVLEALQDLTRLAVAQETGVRSRLMLDIGEYRARRRAELTNIGTQAAQQASDTGSPVTLEPMTAFERKVVHDAVAAAGQRSESEGVEPQRRVVVLPGDGRAGADDGSEQDPEARESASPAV